jgi:Na+(H+)/acetate symporter ActP
MGKRGWAELDSNQRRHSQRIYSPPPLTTRASTRLPRLGTSMAATTFSIDTPLYIAGVVGSRGIAGNWEWWSFGVAHVVMVYVFARLWRRSEIVTDAELTELRYGGAMGATLRGIKAFCLPCPSTVLVLATPCWPW